MEVLLETKETSINITKGNIMNKKHYNQIMNQALIKRNHVLRTNHGLESFMFLGKLYTTNPRRSTNKPYSFDDDSWRTTDKTAFDRFWMVVTGKARKFKKQPSW